jgi:hypothetical protein
MYINVFRCEGKGDILKVLKIGIVGELRTFCTSAFLMRNGDHGETI